MKKTKVDFQMEPAQQPSSSGTQRPPARFSLPQPSAVHITKRPSRANRRSEQLASARAGPSGLSSPGPSTSRSVAELSTAVASTTLESHERKAASGSPAPIVRQKTPATVAKRVAAAEKPGGVFTRSSTSSSLAAPEETPAKIPEIEQKTAEKKTPDALKEAKQIRKRAISKASSKNPKHLIARIRKSNMSTQTAKLLGVKPERDPQFAVNERTITEQEFREQYMHPNLQIAAQINLPFEDIGWCDISETRLFKKCVFYKPAGQLRSLNMIVLVHEMHHISENDPMTDYRDELTPEDLKIYRERLRTGEAQRNPRTYTPAYKVRPNAMAIMNKLNEYWNMPLVHRRELAANDYFKQVDFELPPEIKKMKEHRIQRDEATQ